MSCRPKLAYKQPRDFNCLILTAYPDTVAFNKYQSIEKVDAKYRKVTDAVVKKASFLEAGGMSAKSPISGYLVQHSAYRMGSLGDCDALFAAMNTLVTSTLLWGHVVRLTPLSGNTSDLNCKLITLFPLNDVLPVEVMLPQFERLVDGNVEIQNLKRLATIQGSFIERANRYNIPCSV